ncbi:MAG TPA: serine/threonine-protein kinase [Trebonia sp.]|nr:serine/threonine-protein kinase [Trebonia sp.]
MTDNFSVPPGMRAGLTAGSRIGQYVIGQQVGSGGMAVVYSAHDESLGRTVALKVLSPALAHDEEFRQRFLRESRSVAAVEEPHIVPVYASGESNGVLYIVTRFVPGGDLGTLLRRVPGPFPPQRAVSLVGQVAAALDAAHRIGLVHRDVKPGNILIDSTPGRAEHAYLSDFGLSKATSSATGITASGMFLGTPDYCAPEQITGQPPVSARSDQYSLACVAFSLLTGTVPYERDETMATLFAHVQDPVPSLVARGPWLSPAADAVMGRAMAKDPAARYESCAAFAAALTAALRAPAPAAAPPAPFGGPPAWGQGSPSATPWAPAGLQGLSAGSPTRPATRVGAAGPGGGRRTAIIAGSAVAVLLVGGGIGLAVALSQRQGQPAPTLQDELTGTWAGTYTCSQGVTGLQLNIKAGAGGTATATFSFYALQSNSSVPAGEFAMTGTYSASGIRLNPGRWIIQPANYETVGLKAGPLGDGGKTMSGTVTNSSCTTFTVSKAS